MLSSLAGPSIYKMFSSSPSEVLIAPNIYPMLPERFTAIVPSHFYKYYFAQSIISGNVDLISNPGYQNLLQFYSHSKGLIWIITLHELAGTTLKLNNYSGIGQLIYNGVYVYVFVIP